MKFSGIILLSTVLALGMFAVSCSDKQAIHTGNFRTAEVNNLPQGSLDIVQFKEGTLYAAGWAADKEDGVKVKQVMVYVDNKLVGQAKSGIERPDVGSYFKNPSWVKSGWEMREKIPLGKGRHTAYSVAYDKMDAFFKSVEKEFMVD